MLEEDVASNKAIGSYGATFLKLNQKNSKGLSVLTHCNTGRYFKLVVGVPLFPSVIVTRHHPYLSLFLSLSLATAGYGTALGVIRALHTEGALERAYCTETRPFNQVNIYLLIVCISILYVFCMPSVIIDWWIVGCGCRLFKYFSDAIKQIIPFLVFV